MNETIKINSRQKTIVNIIARYGDLSRERIAEKLPSAFLVSRATLARDLAYLIKNGFITSNGKGPNTIYGPKNTHPLLTYVDLDQYFALEPDERTHALRSFSKNITSMVTGTIASQEKKELDLIFRSFTDTTKSLEPTIFKRELERYVIELSWKSSKIEGNTYTLLETEALITHGQEASGKTKHEALMIVNHKDAFETILDHRTEFSRLTFSHILELHNVLTKNLSIASGIRKHAVGITGTVYRPLDNEFEIREAFERIIKTVNAIHYPIEKAMTISAMIAYLQPFSDGNKRTARMIANAVLMAHDYFPLSYRSVDENEYKEALILFYETNNLYHVKRLFLDQYRFALKTYFLS